MNTVITPTYKDIFGVSKENPAELIKDIPIYVLVSLVGVLNAELYLSTDTKTAQLNILRLLLRRQAPSLLYKIFQIIGRFDTQSNSEVELFSNHLNLAFLHYCLVNGNDGSPIVDTTPQQELRMFKAYLLVSEQQYEDFSFSYENDPLVRYRRNTWPIAASQIHSSYHLNYITDMIKAKCFFDFLQFNSNFQEYVDSFLSKTNSGNSWVYILNLGSQLTEAFGQYPKAVLAPAFINVDETTRGIFEHFKLDSTEYRKEFASGPLNYKGLRARPLFEFKPNSLLVIDWNIFSGKIFQGLLFDFYQHSGISTLPAFPDLISFKRYISEASIEKYLFRKLISSLFSSKHNQIIFDDNKPGHPDTYVRIGSKVLLFEVKDPFPSAKAIESHKFEDIKESIDLKFNTSKKGTGQIAKQIKHLQSSSFEEKTFEALKLKSRNIIIYPIIVYTDDFFRLPGVSLYLQDELAERVNNTCHAEHFKAIKPLSFFNINFLIENIHFLKQTNQSLPQVIDLALKKLQRREKKYRQEPTTSNLTKWNQDFHYIMESCVKGPSKSPKFLPSIFDALDLKQGL